jgi:uncharacterized 2Fe-2S/4Fe-4S cluster protein (DUF4445 family)
MATEVIGRKGCTLLESLREVFHGAEAPCGGSGRCGRCRVLVQAPEASALSGRPLLSSITDEEARLLGPDNLKAGWRLSCLARFVDDGRLSVEMEERSFFIPGARKSDGSKLSPAAGLCAAVDIGTTTISCALADVADGRMVARTAAANWQRSFGPDVVSRIESALQNHGNLAAMQSLVRRQTGLMLGELCRDAGNAIPQRIHLCGNTAMLHFWEGAQVAGLGSMPFRPGFLESRQTEIELGTGSICPGRLLPGISAFIGSDVLAGIVACGIQNNAGRPELLVDIGTNSEIILASGGRMLGTATAAGPAFEGVTISCGLPAVGGAVDHVAWREEGFSFTTLGDLPPAGFCGSGLLDLLACLRRAGLLDESGALKIDPDQTGVRAFRLPANPAVQLTQADVRQLQLAKGAIAAGIRILCRQEGIAPEDIGRVHLAGGFGSNLLVESALAVGLIPAEWAGRVEAVGNTALAGTLMSALDPGLLDLFRRVASEVRVLDLSRDPGFEDAFTEAMRFPVLPARA